MIRLKGPEIFDPRGEARIQIIGAAMPIGIQRRPRPQPRHAAIDEEERPDASESRRDGVAPADAG
jgi:hypothetical protein